MDAFLIVALVGGVAVFLVDLASNRFLSQNRVLNAFVTALAFAVVTFLLLLEFEQRSPPTSEDQMLFAILAVLGGLLVFVVALIVNAFLVRNQVVNALATAIASGLLFPPLFLAYFWLLYQTRNLF